MGFLGRVIEVKEKRAGERERRKAVHKIYDRGNGNSEEGER